MSYDGRLMRQALARFDEDKQRRAENFRARERAVYTKCPRIEEIDRELSHTMAKIIASGLRRGTDPRPAIEALREENLNLQQEKRLLLTRLGLPGDYLRGKAQVLALQRHGLSRQRGLLVPARLLRQGAE